MTTDKVFGIDPEVQKWLDTEFGPTQTAAPAIAEKPTATETPVEKHSLEARIRQKEAEKAAIKAAIEKLKNGEKINVGTLSWLAGKATNLM